MRASAVFCLVALTAFACVPDGTVDPPTEDAGSAPDATVTPDSGTSDPLDAGNNPVDAGFVDAGSPSDSGIDEGPTWNRVQSALSTTCSPCHDPGNVNRRVVVTNPNNIVGVSSGPFTLVAPGNPSRSLLFRKVEGTQAALCTELGQPTRNCGGTMPPAPRAQMSSTNRELVRAWIEAGAPR